MRVPWHPDVEVTADDERRNRDAGEELGLIHVPDRRAAAGIADGIGREERLTRGRHLRRRRGEDGRREETAHHQLLDRCHAVLEDGAAARLHRLRIGQPRRGVGEHEMRQPIRRVRSEPLADHAAERQAAEREARHAARVGERQDILRELGDRVVAGGDARCPVPSRVVAQHLVVRQQIRRLRVPHAMVEAERMRQHEHRTAGDALETVVARRVADL